MLQPLRAAENHLRRTRADVQLDPHVQHLLGDAYSVHAQQQYRGLSVYPHSMVLTVEANGKVTRSGDPLLRIRQLDVVPTLAPEGAARAAFEHLRAGSGEICPTAHEPLFESLGYRPRVLSAFPMPNRPTVVSAGPFHEPVQTNLVVFRVETGPILGWLVSLAVTHYADFTIVIAAGGKDAGKLLYCAAEAASACVASVFPFSAGEASRDIAFPRPVADYPPGIRPANAFRDWVASDQLDGNNALMRIGRRSASSLRWCRTRCAASSLPPDRSRNRRPTRSSSATSCTTSSR